MVGIGQPGGAVGVGPEGVSVENIINAQGGPEITKSGAKAMSGLSEAVVQLPLYMVISIGNRGVVKVSAEDKGNGCFGQFVGEVVHLQGPSPESVADASVGGQDLFRGIRVLVKAVGQGCEGDFIGF